MENCKLFMQPILEGDTIYFETALPLKGEVISLLFPIKKIISVTDSSLNIKYIEGKDYFVKDGKLIIPENSDIKVLDVEEYYRKESAPVPIILDPNLGRYKFKEKRYLMFGEGSFMSDKQIAISYIHDGKWDSFKQSSERNKLKKFFHKLENKEPVNVLFYGDSITVGCNASGTEYGGNKAPFLDPWPVLISKHLESKYQTEVHYFNTSVGGVTSDWARENCEKNINECKPDILFLAFGMNDGGFKKERHFENIKYIINKAKADNPDLEIMLIATTVPNTESNWFVDGTHTQYIELYKTLNLPYVAICDMTHMHLDLLKRKAFKDMSGNNINHPNDFLIRIYAQTILSALGEM